MSAPTINQGISSNSPQPPPKVSRRFEIVMWSAYGLTAAFAVWLIVSIAAGAPLHMGVAALLATALAGVGSLHAHSLYQEHVLLNSGAAPISPPRAQVPKSE